MTPEELDEARAKEACRIWDIETNQSGTPVSLAAIAARLAREGWTPPEPVDPDILAFREWLTTIYASPSKRILADRGDYDNDLEAQAYLAGARMAREQERERAWVLVEYAQADARRSDLVGDRARAAVAKYEEGGR